MENQNPEDKRPYMMPLFERYRQEIGSQHGLTAAAILTAVDMTIAYLDFVYKRDKEEITNVGQDKVGDSPTITD